MESKLVLKLKPEQIKISGDTRSNEGTGLLPAELLSFKLRFLEIKFITVFVFDIEIIPEPD